MAQDARYRTKVYLDTYLDNANLTKDNGETQVTFITCFSNPPYPIFRLFSYAEKEIDLVFAIGDPETTPLMGHDQKPYGYEEKIPICIFCVDKPGITGTKLRWKAEAELRRILENYPYGSLRQLERVRDNDQNLGSTTLYSRELILRYKRSTTV